jgi:hypothetical protein
MATTVPNTSWLNFCNYWSNVDSDMKTYEFFDTPDFEPILTSPNDRSLTIDQKYLGRLDLIAYDYYKDSNLWWIIALANDIQVIPTGMYIGQQLIIPATSTVTQYLRRKKK